LLHKNNKSFSNILRLFDGSLLVAAIAVHILLVFIWGYAHQNNIIPDGPWGINEGNHGPWRGYVLAFLGYYNNPLYILRRTLNGVFQLQLIVVCLSVGCLLLKWQFARLMLLLLNSIYFIILLYTYHWLID